MLHLTWHTWLPCFRPTLSLYLSSYSSLVEKAEGILGESADKKMVGRLVNILAEKETELQTVNHLAQLEKVKAEGELKTAKAVAEGELKTVKAVAEGELKTAKAVAEADSLNKTYVISSAYKKQLSAIAIR